MCNISLDRIINLQNKLVPEMVDLITERYKVLRQISHDQPIGRRTLAKKLGLSERILRSHVDFLKEAGLLDFTLTGMSITEEGAVLLQELRDYVNRLQKLSSLESLLQEKLHLQKVVVLPGDADQDKVVTREIGRVAAGILLRLLADHGKHIVAVTGGTPWLPWRKTPSATNRRPLWSRPGAVWGTKWNSRPTPLHGAGRPSQDPVSAAVCAGQRQ